MMGRSPLEDRVRTCDAGQFRAGGLLDSLSHRGAEIIALLFESLGLGLPSIARPSQNPAPRYGRL